MEDRGFVNSHTSSNAQLYSPSIYSHSNASLGQSLVSMSSNGNSYNTSISTNGSASGGSVGGVGVGVNVGSENKLKLKNEKSIFGRWTLKMDNELVTLLALQKESFVDGKLPIDVWNNIIDNLKEKFPENALKFEKRSSVETHFNNVIKKRYKIWKELEQNGVGVKWSGTRFVLEHKDFKSYLKEDLADKYAADVKILDRMINSDDYEFMTVYDNQLAPYLLEKSVSMKGNYNSNSNSNSNTNLSHLNSSNNTNSNNNNSTNLNSNMHPNHTLNLNNALNNNHVTQNHVHTNSFNEQMINNLGGGSSSMSSREPTPIPDFADINEEVRVKRFKTNLNDTLSQSKDTDTLYKILEKCVLEKNRFYKKAEEKLYRLVQLKLMRIGEYLQLTDFISKFEQESQFLIARVENSTNDQDLCFYVREFMKYKGNADIQTSRIEGHHQQQKQQQQQQQHQQQQQQKQQQLLHRKINNNATNNHNASSNSVDFFHSNPSINKRG